MHIQIDLLKVVKIYWDQYQTTSSFEPRKNSCSKKKKNGTNTSNTDKSKENDIDAEKMDWNEKI